MFSGSLATGLPSEGRVRAVTSAVQDFWCPPYEAQETSSAVLISGNHKSYRWKTSSRSIANILYHISRASLSLVCDEVRRSSDDGMAIAYTI